MDDPTRPPRHDADDAGIDHRHLPEPVRLEDTITSQDVVEAADPTMGRDADTEWLLTYGAG